MKIKHIDIGKNAPKLVNAIIEIPRGSRNKYEYDEHLDTIKLDRVLHSSIFYPADYGFIPHTRAEDGDHVDILVLVTEPTFPGCLLEARPLGALEMTDEGGKDWKIIAVAHKDPFYSHIQSIDDLNPSILVEIKNFFETYKLLEQHKSVTVSGWETQERSYEVIQEGLRNFKS